jgi:hypothetical protein
MNIPKENCYWRRVDSSWGTVVSKTHGRLTTSGMDSLSVVVEYAKGAGIPKKNWNLITMENDWSGCCYEGDEPSIIWTFPLSVFED